MNNKDVARNKLVFQAGIVSASLLVALVACGGYGTPPPAVNMKTNTLTLPQMFTLGYLTPLCSAPAPNHAHCTGFAFTAQGLQLFPPHRSGAAAAERSKLSSAAPAGLGPNDLQTFYGLSTASATLGAGKTVAVIVYGSTQPVESYLSVYRAQYGLPPCTTANGCYSRLDENGGTNYPAAGGWEAEAALDTDMISAICPNCHITVLEASTPTLADLGTAVNTAARLRVSAINNSYGIVETGMQTYASAYNHPGIPITAAAGNGGFSTIQEVPAAYTTVTAVGATISYPLEDGTDLANRESAYAATSGCSTVIAKPAWQHDSACSMRTVADIAFMGFGLAEYDGSGWIVICGSSASAAAISAMYALAGSTANDASGLYTNAAQLHDVVDGDAALISASQKQCIAPVDDSTGVVTFFSANRRVADASSYPTYLCSGQVGYDAPTGNGTPQGLNAFNGTATASSPSPLPSPLPSGCASTGGTPNPHPTENAGAGNPCTS